MIIIAYDFLSRDIAHRILGNLNVMTKPDTLIIKFILKNKIII